MIKLFVLRTFAVTMAIFLLACDKRELATGFAQVAGDELIDKRIAINTGDYWYIKYTPSENGTLYTRITVNNSAPVSVDLMDETDFRSFPSYYNYYTSYHRIDILDEMIVGELSSGNNYVLAVWPRSDGPGLADVTIKAYFVSDTEK